jgi:hypothetical protein
MKVNDFSLAEYDEGNYAIRVPRPCRECARLVEKSQELRGALEVKAFQLNISGRTFDSRHGFRPTSKKKHQDSRK